MIPEIQGISNEEKLDKLGLYSFRFGMLRGALIEAYRIFTGKDRVDKEILFSLVKGSGTKGHHLKIRVSCSRDMLETLLHAESGGGLKLSSSNGGECWFNCSVSV